MIEHDATHHPRASHGPSTTTAASDAALPGKQTLVPGPGGGAALPRDVRGKMEGAFGADFSQVRVHEGAHVAALGAQAYTQGTDIHFAPGQYQPASQPGQELLGHELTHVVQQSQGRVAATRQAKGVGINDDASLEREADEQGARAAHGQAAGPMAQPRGGASIERGASPRSSTSLVQCFGFGAGVELRGPIEAAMSAAELSRKIAAWLDPLETAPALHQARLDVTAAPAGVAFHIGSNEIAMDDAHRALLREAIRKRLMSRVVAVRTPLLVLLAAAHTPVARRAVQDQLRTAARPFLDELRDPAQPGARFQHDDPAVQREVLAALTLDGEGHAEDELVDQAAHGEAGPRDRARSVGALPTGAWCGAFTYTQQRGAGLTEQARAALHSTGPHQGIDALLDYEHHDQVIWTGSAWRPVQAYHTERTSLRRLTRTPQTPTVITPRSVAAPQGLDLQPGDIVLIDNFRGTYADHITQCRSYDPSTGALETIAGNEGGGAGHVAASAQPRDLNTNPAAQTVAGRDKPSRVYAYGRFSIVDYEVHTYLPAMPADPTESPEAMAARQHGRGHH